MNVANPWLLECEREPIHRPGAIQGWGALLVAAEADLIIHHASVNLSNFLNCSASDVIGTSLRELFNPELLASFVAARTETSAAGQFEPLPSQLAGRSSVDVSAHRIEANICIDIKPVLHESNNEPGLGSWSDARVVVETLRSAPSSVALFDAAATQFRRATGFDRAMVYRFDHIGHGEVVGEARASDLEPFLGLHYPASDVPRQARLLYLRQRVRVIADVEAPPVALISAFVTAESPDLSLSALRSASPVHLQYLRNMSVRSSIVVSLVVDGKLWGLLVAHDRRPRLTSTGIRAFCDVIGQVTSLMITTLQDMERRNSAMMRATRATALARRLAAECNDMSGIAEALAGVCPDLLAIFEASGAIVRLGGHIVSVGTAPKGPEAAVLLATMLAATGNTGEPFATHEAGALLPPDLSAELRSASAGMLILPIVHGSGNAILWLRPEQERTVRWGGDPGQPVEANTLSGKLSPRRSFSEWKEVVRGQSWPWSSDQIEAARSLRQEIDRLIVHFAETELERLRHHDPLTGLPNRRLLRERLDGWMQERRSCCILAMQIDRFATLKDGIGEAKSDALLLHFGERLMSIAATSGAMMARIGVDEFAIFGDHMMASEAEELAAKLRAALGEPFWIGDTSIGVTASLGIASATSNTPELCSENLLAQADLALQAAKQSGGNRSLVFHGGLREGADRRLDLEQELRAAINGDSARAGKFYLVYQPCVSLVGQAGPEAQQQPGRKMPPLRGFEALLRWNHPRLGNVGPGEFISVAEDCGLIGQIGDWVLHQAVDQLAAWRELAADLPKHAWRVAVNVSPRQLAQPGFAADVFKLLARRGVAPQSLTVEVTEGVFADDDATSVVAELRHGGIKIAVDDFGIGYSSLSYIRRLPADELKLDRSFLQNPDGAPQHENFLAALVQLARAANLSVLAEGIETEAHLAAVAGAGCDAAQGWLFSAALPADEATQWIVSARPSPERNLASLPFSFRSIVDSANEAVMVTTADLDAPGPSIVYVNPAFTRMSGYTLGEVLGRSPRLMQGPKTDHHALTLMVQELRGGRPAHSNVYNYTNTGMPFWSDMHISPLRDSSGRITHFSAIQRDITHDVRRFEELESLALRDPLTSIANRRGVERFVEHMTQQKDILLSVGYIDLDNFKAVNDTHGHLVGDALLLGIADLLTENVRRADFVGRLGGDEFVVCMPSIRPSAAVLIVRRLHQAIANTDFPTPQGPIRINCSIGIATMRPEEKSIDGAIARADAAAYAAKAAGRGRVVLESEQASTS